jgi:hypothetical protein
MKKEQRQRQINKREMNRFGLMILAKINLIQKYFRTEHFQTEVLQFETFKRIT